jgi:hypothetical protein
MLVVTMHRYHIITSHGRHICINSGKLKTKIDGMTRSGMMLIPTTSVELSRP